MDNENIYRYELIEKYRTAMEDKFRYIPWLEQKRGNRVSDIYTGNDSPDRSLPITVYESTLLAFIKEMQATGLMDRNYVYVYSRYGVRTAKDEMNWLVHAELKNIDIIFAVLSKYVLGGMTKGRLWVQAVENGIFLQALIRIKDILDVWDRPLA